MYAAWLAEISGIPSYFSSTYTKAFEISQLVVTSNKVIFMWIPLKCHLTCDISKWEHFWTIISRITIYRVCIRSQDPGRGTRLLRRKKPPSFVAKLKAPPFKFIWGILLLPVRNPFTWKINENHENTTTKDAITWTSHLTKKNTNFITFMCHLALINSNLTWLCVMSKNVIKLLVVCSHLIQISVLTVCKQLHFRSNEGMMTAG